MKIFLTGASGYIGSAVAQRLVREGAIVRGLIRDAAKVDSCRQFGVDPVVGELGDTDLLAAEARAADAVINAADSDHRASAEALVGALAGTGKPLLHSSGISIVGDEARGEPSDRIHDETDPLHPEPIRAHRVDIDQLILAAEGCCSAVLCNAMVYGDAANIPAESVLIAALARTALDTGQARVVGRGLNRWSNVHLEDVADMYSVALQRRATGLLYVENGEQDVYTIAQAIAERFDIGTPTTTTVAEAEQIFGWGLANYALGSNARVRGHRGKALGWQPRHESIVDWIRLPHSELLKNTHAAQGQGQ
ncbi:MAG: hypothetical protein QOE89_3212 [Pseudonocardiales bacterium]|jgi:nucleoside-diphosphate-sugar epimerase|nr:hypothetical protein [Pseudonocardiales bacterium]